MYHFSSVYRDSTVDEDYCINRHTCSHNSDRMCPDHHGSFQNRECYSKSSYSDKINYQCLNRNDVSNDTIFRTSAFAKKARFPLLNDALEFNDTGFWCDRGNDIFLKWTKEDIRKLYSKIIPECRIKKFDIIAGPILVRLMKNDRSFDGRNLVPDLDIG